MKSPGSSLLVNALAFLNPQPPRNLLHSRGYTFAGFGARQEASRHCGIGGKLAMPKTVKERQALKESIVEAVKDGNMSETWPNSAVWLGSHWDIAHSHWLWDDGSVIANTDWVQHRHGDSDVRPYMYMDARGTIHTTQLGFLRPWDFGIFCEGDVQVTLGDMTVTTTSSPAATTVAQEGLPSLHSSPSSPSPSSTAWQATGHMPVTKHSFCCLAATTGDPCNSCSLAVKNGTGPYCARSREACLSCGDQAVWCGPVVDRDGRIVVTVGDGTIPAELTDYTKVHLTFGNEQQMTGEVISVQEPQPPPGGIHRGTMYIDGLGKMWLGGDHAGASADKVIMRHESGLSVLTEHRADWSSESLVQFKLLGSSISFTVDLSRVGCACNLAVYLVSSPALGENGEPNKGESRGEQPPYYCDANKVGGQWCPEVDIMEANNHAFAATMHKCGSPTRYGHFTDCDRKGCDENTKDMGNAYGPGSSFTIDTTSPFRVTSHFAQIFGRLAGMVTTLQQGDNQVVMNHSQCDVEYLASIGTAMGDGMSLRMSYWGNTAETMSWMDYPKCSPEQSCETATAGPGIFSDFAIVEDRNHSTRSYNHTVTEFKHFMEKVSDSVDVHQVRDGDGSAARPWATLLHFATVPVALLGAFLAAVGFVGRLLWVSVPSRSMAMAAHTPLIEVNCHAKDPSVREASVPTRSWARVVHMQDSEDFL